MNLVITGAELMSCIGNSRADTFGALCAGVSGNRTLVHLDSSRFPGRRAYEIDDGRVSAAQQKTRASEWLCRSVRQALHEAGLSPTDTDQRVGLIVGTGLRELRSLELWWADEVPLDVVELNVGRSARRSMRSDGPAFHLSNACSASSFALGLAADLLQLGEVDAMVVAGCDSITESMYALLDRVSPQPVEQVRPFSGDPKGVLLGEGAAAVVLESAKHAEARGAKPLARLLSVGMSCDAYHETAPSLDGVIVSIGDAHRRAGVHAEDVDVVFAHGTGTALNDKTELLAIREVFGSAASEVPITGLKSMLGHTAGASGLMAVVVAIETLRHGTIPPTLGLTERMEEAEGLNIVAPDALHQSVRVAQINAFGFGGVNAVAVLGAA